MDTSTSNAFTSCPLYHAHPDQFQGFVGTYAEIIQLAVRGAVSGNDRHVFTRVRSLARSAGEMRAVPQDLIAVHLSALADIVKTKPQPMVRAGIRQSRLLLVKMIGELALYYREQAS